MGISNEVDQVIEIPVRELQAFFDDLIQIYNNLNEVLRESGIMRGRELAELNSRASNAIKNERSPLGKLLLLNAYIKQEIAIIQKGLKDRLRSSSGEEGQIRQAITKIQLRAQAIVEHIKTIAEGKKEIAFSSIQARAFLAGREGKPPSRRDTIRALRRAEKICPTLSCAHTPNDGRQTIRLTGKAEDLMRPGLKKIFDGRSSWQRSGWGGIGFMMNFGHGGDA
jgi:ElaB/YqjD/DUF883 family membrane-anchored ribosome-binding protein